VSGRPTETAARKLGRRIRRVREEAGLSQRQVMRGSGFSPAFLSRIEHGERYPSERVLRVLASRLGTTAIRLESPRRRTCPHCGGRAGAEQT
jgi:transcriptional regulator with XRE-family HTH domain